MVVSYKSVCAAGRYEWNSIQVFPWRARLPSQCGGQARPPYLACQPVPTTATALLVPNRPLVLLGIVARGVGLDHAVEVELYVVAYSYS